MVLAHQAPPVGADLVIRLLAPDAQHWPYRKTGRFLFTELTRPSKKVPMAARVWVSEKGVGIREPSEHEGRAAADARREARVGASQAKPVEEEGEEDFREE